MLSNDIGKNVPLMSITSNELHSFHDFILWQYFGLNYFFLIAPLEPGFPVAAVIVPIVFITVIAGIIGGFFFYRRNTAGNNNEC